MQRIACEPEDTPPSHRKKAFMKMIPQKPGSETVSYQQDQTQNKLHNHAFKARADTQRRIIRSRRLTRSFRFWSRSDSTYSLSAGSDFTGPLVVRGGGPPLMLGNGSLLPPLLSTVTGVEWNRWSRPPREESTEPPCDTSLRIRGKHRGREALNQ